MYYDVTFPVCKRTGYEEPIQKLIEPNSRILSYGSLAPEDIQSCFLEAEQKLSPNIPTEVRERLIVARKLGTYGYFQWEFFTVSLFWSLTAIEMALRNKFSHNCPPPYTLVKKGKTRCESELWRFLFTGWRIQGMNCFNGRFRSLMDWAVENELIPLNIPIYLEELLHSFDNKFPVAEKQNTRAQILAREIPSLRNELTHPNVYNIMLIAKSAIDGYRQAIEVINLKPA